MRLLFIVLVCCFVASAQDDDKIARGKYLVENVARCQQCHTPHLNDGSFVASAPFKGTTIDLIPVNQPPNWRTKVPDISSTGTIWARWTEEGVVKFLETGKDPRGGKANPPMPAYNLKHDDAVAIVAYLRSIK